MIRLALQLVLLVFVVCSYCGKDFLSLGRHSSRCKSRIMDNEPDISQTSGYLNVEERAVIANSQEIASYCGKKCTGMKGLKVHRRSCRTLHGLNDNLNAKLEEEDADMLSVVKSIFFAFHFKNIYQIFKNIFFAFHFILKIFLNIQDTIQLKI